MFSLVLTILGPALTTIFAATTSPECACMPAKRGYAVHPVPTPCSTKADGIYTGGNNQEMSLFKLGKCTYIFSSLMQDLYIILLEKL